MEKLIRFPKIEIKPKNLFVKLSEVGIRKKMVILFRNRRRRFGDAEIKISCNERYDLEPTSMSGI